jgi:hypothetical protein
MVSVWCCTKIVHEVETLKVILNSFFFTLSLDNNKQLFNFMKHHSCLLLSLFDRLLILNSNAKGSGFNAKNYTISFKNADKSNIILSLFYDSNDSKSNNYGFVIVKGKVQKFKFDELTLPMVSNDHKYLCFSKLSHDHNDYKEHLADNTEKLMGKIYKEKIEGLIKEFIKQTNKSKQSTNVLNKLKDLSELCVEIEVLAKNFDEWVKKVQESDIDLDELDINIHDLYDFKTEKTAEKWKVMGKIAD